MKNFVQEVLLGLITLVLVAGILYAVSLSMDKMLSLTDKLQQVQLTGGSKQ
jgi:hypothetical protein